MLTARPNDKSDAGFKDWRFMTVHFWGEDPVGDWKLHIIDRVSSLLMARSHFTQGKRLVFLADVDGSPGGKRWDLSTRPLRH